MRTLRTWHYFRFRSPTLCQQIKRCRFQALLRGLSAPARPIWPYLRVGRLEDGRADSQTGVLSPAATVHMIDYVFDLSLYSRKFTSP